MTLTTTQRIMAHAKATFEYADQLAERQDDLSDFYQGKAIGLLQAFKILQLADQTTAR